MTVPENQGVWITNPLKTAAKAGFPVRSAEKTAAEAKKRPPAGSPAGGREGMRVLQAYSFLTVMLWVAVPVAPVLVSLTVHLIVYVPEFHP